MSHHLYLVGSDRQRQSPPPWTPRRYDLQRQPQRPGEICREIHLDAGPHDRVESRAAASGLPSSLWATLAVEGRRCVAQAARLYEVHENVVTELLDGAAGDTWRSCCARQAVTGSRLRDYGQSLIDSSARQAHPTLRGLLLRPSLAMLTAWSLAAEASGLSIGDWALRSLPASTADPVRWEASAAFQGQTLAEWTLVQAVRRLRSASTLAHSAG